MIEKERDRNSGRVRKRERERERERENSNQLNSARKLTLCGMRLPGRIIYIYIYICVCVCVRVRVCNKFTYLESSASSTKTDINTRLAKAETAIDSLSAIWKSDLCHVVYH